MSIRLADFGRRLLWIVLLALLVTACDQIALPGASEEEPDAATSADDDDVAPLQLVEVGVSATGEVVPAEYATLSFAVSGEIVELLVEEGDTVEEGDIVAQLDTRDYDLAIGQARAAVAVAEASLERAKAGPRDEEIEQAQDQVAAANARISVAARQRDQLYAPPNEDTILDAQQQLIDAQMAYDDLLETHETVLYNADEFDWDEYEPGDRTPLDGEEGLRRAIEATRLNVEAAQAYLDFLTGGPSEEAGRAASARIWAAAAQRDAAQARLDLLLAGPSEAQIAVSEAELRQAQTAVASAEAARDQAFLTVPFSGTISKQYVEQNEWINSGQPVVQLADLDDLRVETTDLNELDIARVEDGAVVSVTFDALEDVEVDGEVARIAPRASEGAGVNYTVIILLDEIPDALRWGMTAFVDIDTE